MWNKRVKLIWGLQLMQLGRFFYGGHTPWLWKLWSNFPKVLQGKWRVENSWREKFGSINWVFLSMLEGVWACWFRLSRALLTKSGSNAVWVWSRLPEMDSTLGLKFKTCLVNYSTPIASDLRLYYPSRLFESDVTTRYLKWWRKETDRQMENCLDVPPGFPPNYCWKND